MNLTLKRFGFPVLRSYCEVQFFEESRIDAKQYARRLSAEMLRIDQKYSRFRRDSLTTEINFSAGNELGIKLDKETRDLLEKAAHYHALSDGLYDITAGILWRVWDFDKPRIPSQKDIDALLPRIGFDRLSWRGARLLLPARMEIDLTALIKRYAVDAAARLARDAGVRSGLINLGGDFAVIGPQPSGDPWPVGIADPGNPQAVVAKMALTRGGLASSGDYNKLVEREGEQYRCVLNPRTGWPGSGLQAVSVIADACLEAGAMADIAMLKETDAARAWLADSGLAYVYRQTDGEIAGPGLMQSEPAQATESSEETNTPESL